MKSIRRYLKVTVLLAGILGFLGMVLLSVPGRTLAGDDSIEEMQKKLNQGVMQKEFSVEDTAKIDAYIKDAMKKDLKPQEKPPAGWRPGYTCADLHNYYEYRNCLYYYRYHGYYWR